MHMILMLNVTYLNVTCKVHLHLIWEFEGSDIVVSNDTCTRRSSLRSSPPVTNQFWFPDHRGKVHNIFSLFKVQHLLCTC